MTKRWLSRSQAWPGSQLETSLVLNNKSFSALVSTAALCDGRPTTLIQWSTSCSMKRTAITQSTTLAILADSLWPAPNLTLRSMTKRGWQECNRSVIASSLLTLTRSSPADLIQMLQTWFTQAAGTDKSAFGMCEQTVWWVLLVVGPLSVEMELTLAPTTTMWLQEEALLERASNCGTSVIWNVPWRNLCGVLPQAVKL